MRRGAPGSSSFSAGTSGGGGGGGAPSRFSSTHLPRSTGDVVVACEVTSSTAPLPSRPRRVSSGSVTRRKWLPNDVRDAVVLRQPLVDERVVGGQQIEHAAVLAHDALEKQLGLAPERLPQVVVEVRKDSEFGHDAAEIAQLQPLAGEIADERLRPRIGQHAPHLLRQHLAAGRAVPPAAGSISSSSGMLLQRKNDSRDASSTSATRYGVPGAMPAGSRSGRNTNEGLARMRRSANPMPVSKSPRARSCL